MRTYPTHSGPVYVDLDVGEASSALPGKLPEAELLGFGYDGPTGRPGRAEMGWVRVSAGGRDADIPLGWWRTVGAVRVAAEINAAYNADPWRKDWERRYWRLEHDARVMLSEAARPLTPTDTHAFPIVSDAWSWGYTHNWLSKYSGSTGLSPTHEGVDIDCPVGVATVRAATAGEIVYVGPYKKPNGIGGEGIVVSVVGDDGLGYLYAHMRELQPSIAEGRRVELRHPIGPTGMSGAENINITPHLHFEMIWGESREALLHALRPPWFDESLGTIAFRINPLPYLFEWFERYLANEDG